MKLLPSLLLILLSIGSVSSADEMTTLDASQVGAEEEEGTNKEGRGIGSRFTGNRVNPFGNDSSASVTTGTRLVANRNNIAILAGLAIMFSIICKYCVVDPLLKKRRARKLQEEYETISKQTRKRDIEKGLAVIARNRMPPSGSWQGAFNATQRSERQLGYKLTFNKNGKVQGQASEYKRTLEGCWTCSDAITKGQARVIWLEQDENHHVVLTNLVMDGSGQLSGGYRASWGKTNGDLTVAPGPGTQFWQS